jgi:hypothetical protein
LAFLRSVPESTERTRFGSWRRWWPTKTLSNYTNHLADTPLDRAFAKAAWAKAA